MLDIKFTNNKIDADRVALIHCQVFGLREAGFSIKYCNIEESLEWCQFKFGIYNFEYKNQMYSIRIAPFADGTVNRKCLWYIWSEKGNTDVMERCKEINDYLKKFGVRWDKYVFGIDNFNGVSPDILRN